MHRAEDCCPGHRGQWTPQPVSHYNERITEVPYACLSSHLLPVVHSQKQRQDMHSQHLFLSGPNIVSAQGLRSVLGKHFTAALKHSFSPSKTMLCCKMMHHVLACCADAHAFCLQVTSSSPRSHIHSHWCSVCSRCLGHAAQHHPQPNREQPGTGTLGQRCLCDKVDDRKLQV